MSVHRQRAILVALTFALLVALPTTLSASPTMPYGVSTPDASTRGQAGMATLRQSARLVAGDAVPHGSFGEAVAVSADGATAIVGAPRIQANLTDPGAAYIFTRVGALWIQQQILMPRQSAPGDCFGYAVALSADGATAVIGAPAITAYDDYPNPGTNATYVFARDGATWTQRQALTAGDTAYGDFYGIAVAISGDGATAAIGATAKNGDAGAAYIFARGSDDRWTQQRELGADDGAPKDNFGDALALSGTGDTAVIGAGAKDARTGAAYVFNRGGDGWTQQQKLRAGDGAPKDFFGTSVAVSTDGTTAVIGAPQHALGEYTPGTAYVFARGGSGWSQQAQLVPADTMTASDFAVALALSDAGDTAVIGEYGAAYVFTRAGASWSLQQRWADGGAATFFGSAVALSADGSTVLVGGPNEGDRGAAYVYGP